MDLTAASSHFLADKDIIVIGGGVAGPAFALALHKQWLGSLTHSPPRIRIYERDSHEERVGREGYTLSVRNDAISGGVQALDMLGLYEEVMEVSVTGRGEGEDGRESGGFCIWDRDWKPLLKVSPKPVGPKALWSMRVRRNALQKVIADALTETGTPIAWGKACVGVEQLETGKVKVAFEDGSEEQADLVVAADGARSKVLGFLRPENRLNFTGAVCLGGTGRFESSKYVPAPVDRDWGLLLAGDGIGLFAAPVDETSALWSLSYLAEKPRERLRHPLTSDQVQSILDEARMRGKAVPEPFLKLVDNSDASTLMVFNAMDRQPFFHDADDPEHGRVIFLGDANHAVSPFAGNGANLALMDGLDLATCLVSQVSLKNALIEYDKRSMSRGRKTIKYSHYTIDMAHAKGIKLVLYKTMIKILGWLLKLFLG